MSQPELRAADNGQFYIHWSEDRRSKRKSLLTNDPAVARRKFGEWLLLDRNAVAPAERTVAECWAVYRKRHIDVRVASPATLLSAWKTLGPHFGGMVASAVSQDDVDLYVNKRTSGALGKNGRAVAPQTVRREVLALMACLNFNKVAHDAFDVPERGQPRDRWLNETETTALLSAARKVYGVNSRVETFLMLALHTGGRLQAILDLSWGRVDFDNRVVHFELPGRRTTKKRRVSVPMSNALRTYLGIEQSLTPVANAAQRVVSGKFAAWHAVKRVARAAGLTGVSPHVLRHTAATNMARRGVPLFVIAKILGNSVQVVERTYAKHAVDDLRDAIEKISGG